MTTTYNVFMSIPPDGSRYLIPPRYWRWLGSRTTRVVLLWLVALGVGGQRLWHAWHSFDNKPGDPPERQRADGNSGHAEIDFGGQWVMGRMILEGNARTLYHRDRQWIIVRSAYPISDESPIVKTDRIALPAFRLFRQEEGIRSDFEWMMFSFIGENADSPEWRTLGGAIAAAVVPSPFPPAIAASVHAAGERVNSRVVADLETPQIGGALYPPIHAYAMVPFAMIEDPRTSYRVAQIVWLGVALFAALGVSLLSRGRIWWSVATIAILLYPGCRGCLDLAQNATFTLSLVIWGWVLANRGWTIAGGATWGLLATKPTWALAFLLVPLLTRRWRFLLAMCGVGGLLVLATLPFVGIQTWFDWLKIGQEASKSYDVIENWICLSRDLNGLFRRWLLDFHVPEAQRNNTLATRVGLSLWLGTLAITIGLTLWKVDRKQFVGPGPAFVFLGAFLWCYRFMYYDSLLSFAAVAVLLADPNIFRRITTFQCRTRLLGASVSTASSPMMGYVNSLSLTLIVLLGLYENCLIGSQVRSTFSFGFLAESGSPSRLELDVPIRLAIDTILTYLLWAWLGVRVFLGEGRTHELPRSESSAAPMSGERISDSPTSTA